MMTNSKNKSPEKKGYETTPSTLSVKAKEKRHDDQTTTTVKTCWSSEISPGTAYKNQETRIEVYHQIGVQVVPVSSKTVDKLKQSVSEAIYAVKNSPGGWPIKSLISIDIKPEHDEKHTPENKLIADVQSDEKPKI